VFVGPSTRGVGTQVPWTTAEEELPPLELVALRLTPHHMQGRSDGEPRTERHEEHEEDTCAQTVAY